MAKNKTPRPPKDKSESSGSAWTNIGSAIADLALAFDKKKRGTVADYCPVEGIVNDYTYFLDNTALVTTFFINGATFMMGAAERTTMMEELKDYFSTILREPNSALQLVFQRDRSQVETRLRTLYAPMYGKAKSLKMRAEPIFEERIQRMLPYLSGTEVYLSVYTFPGQLISKESLKEFRQQQKEKEHPDFPHEKLDGIQIYQEPDVIEHRHDATVRSLGNALKRLKMEATKMHVRDALAMNRRMLFPEETSTKWKVRLPGDRVDPRLHMVNSSTGKYLTDSLICPRIGVQMAAAPVIREGKMDSVVQVGSRYVASQIMEMTPDKPKPFEDLLEHIGDLSMPIRASMTFFGGSDMYRGKISTKKSMAYLAAFTFPANKRISAAGETLDTEINEKGKQACGFSMVVSTWGDSHRQASERIRKLGRSMDAWGDTQSAPEVGDPFLAFTASTPGWSNNMRHILLTTVDKMLVSLPLNQITSPWKEGVMFFKNRNGGIFPYAPLSSQQQTTNILTFSPPGGGKSVLISTLISAAVFDPVLQGLPKIAAIDIGNSSKGVVNMLRAIAPPELKERFMHVEFELTERFGINVMDTRLGCPYPTSVERGFLTNFLTMILTPIGSQEPIQDASSIASTLIKELYTVCAEDQQTKYVRGQDHRVTEWLSNQRDFEVKPTTTWWQVVYFAMQKKAYDIAGLAQRFAVPNLRMLPAQLVRSETLKNLYKTDGDGVDEILLHAKRLLMGFLDQYPSLCKPSNFDFQETDVCIIDLNKVTQDTGVEGERRTTIAYLVSRYLLGKDFLTNKDILNEMPPIAQEFYRSKIEKLEVVRKYLIYDEFHRTTGAKAVQKTVVDDMRNGRKFNLMVMLASQNFDDFSDEIIQQATVRTVLRVDLPSHAELLGDKYGWGPTIREALKKEVRGSGPDGATFLMHASGLRTDDGQSTQVLTNIIGSTELAAYGTVREDAALRDAVLDAGIPYWEAIQLIGRLFPQGVKSIVEESMREKRSGNSDVKSSDDEIKGALTPMIGQVKDAYTQMRLNSKS